MKKICFAATMPEVVHAFLRNHIRASAERWKVGIITHPANADLIAELEAKFIPLSFERKPSLFQDFFALIRLVKILLRERFDLIYSIGPKTGLLVMTASWITGVPKRIHIFTGQGWVNKSGWKREIFKAADRLIVRCATHILVDSPSQRDFLVSEGILKHGEGVVIGHGSVCGIDVGRFHPDAESRATVRSELCINPDQIIILYLGRMNRDKGILDLAAAFASLASHRTDIELVLVGAEEDVTFEQLQNICHAHRERLHRVSFTPSPERYMAAADIFCLPSYREGFGQVIIEAAACGLPAVASRIYGVTDAVDDGKTGVLVPAGDVESLSASLSRLISDPVLRHQMGEMARVRTQNIFSSSTVTDELLNFFDSVLTESSGSSGN